MPFDNTCGCSRYAYTIPEHVHILTIGVLPIKIFASILAPYQSNSRCRCSVSCGGLPFVADFIGTFLVLTCNVLQDAKNKVVENVVILSGDHLYRMDYMDFVQKHKDSGADITVSCVPMDDSRASDYGLMKIDDQGRVLHFHEKPKGADLKNMVLIDLF